MKKIKNTIVYTLLAVLGLSSLSCTKDFIDVNIDPIGEREVEARRLLQPALVNVLYANMIRNWNFNNQLMQVSVEISDAEGKVFRYDVRRTWADYTWNSWYTNLTDLKDIYTIASKPESLNKSYQGISLITQSWVYSLLTDTYGDVPYTEANMGREGLMEPKFDKQKDIYADMFKKLEEANDLLKEGTAIEAASDPVYKGDILKWRRFGNSLYLRLLLRASGKAEVASTVTAKIKEIVDANPAEYPIIKDNSETAKILWNGTSSSTAVYSSPFMIGIRAVDFRNMPICDFFLGKLVSWEDPRVDPALGIKSVPRFGIDKGVDGYVGVPSGYEPGSGVTIQAHFNSDAETDKSTLQTDPNTGIIMSSAEVNFILAEAAAKGWINGPVENYYYQGMVDAITYWMPKQYTGRTDPKFISYIADAPAIKWDPTLPLDDLAGGDSQMEKIHIQKYYANFLVDFQQWFEYRRTGHPILPRGKGLGDRKMPARLNYPLVTQSTNPTNYKNAVATQGADDINTLVWWQKP